LNWDAIGAVGELIGAAGVIASLLYLSIQIRRSDQTTRAESLSSLLDGWRDRSVLQSFLNAEVPDLLAKGLTDFEMLDASEKRRFFYLICETIFQTQQAMQLHQRGLLPEVDYNAWIYYAATIIRTPGGTQVWPMIETTITPTVRGVMNDYIAANPDTPSYLDLNPLLRYSNEEAG
jgi:hypothetical protein